MARAKTQGSDVEIVIGVDTSKATPELDKLTAAEKRAEVGAGKLADATKRTGAAAAELGTKTKTAAAETDALADTAAKGTSKLDTLATGAKKMVPALKSMAVQAAQGGISLGSVASAATSAAMAFGPWGVAIGVAGTALYSLVTAQSAAKKAADEHTKALRKQQDEYLRLLNLENIAAEQHSAERDFLRRGGQFAAEADLDRLEEKIIIAEARGENTSKMLTEQARMRAAVLQLEADAATKGERHDAARALHAEAEAVKRADKLRLLREENTAEKEITKEKGKQKEQNEAALAWANEMRLLRNAPLMSRESSDTRAFAAEMQNVKDPRLERPGVKLIDPFSTAEELDRIEKESQARIKATEDAKDAAAERAKKRHEEEMARHEELIARQEKAGQVAGDTVAGLAQAWLQAGDLSARGFKKALAAWGKAESIRLAGVAISEGIQALVSIAFFNYPQAALHGAAAAAAAAGSAVIAGMTAAVGGFGGGGVKNVKGFSGDQFGAGTGTGAANDSGSTPVSNSQKDQIPTSSDNTQHAQAGSSGASRGGTSNHFGPGSIVVLGAIDEQSAVKIAQGIKKTERKLGNTGS